MAMSRSLGGTLFTTRPPIAISPRLISSRPAIMRSSVDLPQPEGPTRTTNSPSGISTETPCSTCTEPKYFSTCLTSTAAIPVLPCRAVAWRAGRCARGRRGLRSPEAGTSVGRLWPDGGPRATGGGGQGAGPRVRSAGTRREPPTLTRAAILALALLAPMPAWAVNLGRVEELSRTLADSFGDAAAASDRCGASYRPGLRRQLDAFLARYVDADAVLRAGNRFERAAA